MKYFRIIRYLFNCGYLILYIFFELKMDLFYIVYINIVLSYCFFYIELYLRFGFISSVYSKMYVKKLFLERKVLKRFKG